MKYAIRGGVILAGMVTVVNVVLIATGLSNNYFVGGLGALALYILFNIGAVVLTLLATRSESGYKPQVINALVLGCVGAIGIFVTSYLLMGVLFPDAIAQQNEAFGEFFAGIPSMTEEQLSAAMTQIEARTAMGEAFKGAVGTLVTSLVLGLIAAIFLRRKD